MTNPYQAIAIAALRAEASSDFGAAERIWSLLDNIELAKAIVNRGVMKFVEWRAGTSPVTGEQGYISEGGQFRKDKPEPGSDDTSDDGHVQKAAGMLIDGLGERVKDEVGNNPGLWAKVKDKALTAAAHVYMQLVKATPAMEQAMNLFFDATDDPRTDFKKIGYEPSLGFGSHTTGDPVKAQIGISAHLAATIASKVLGAAITKYREWSAKRKEAKQQQPQSFADATAWIPLAAQELAAMYDGLAKIVGFEGGHDPKKIEDILRQRLAHVGSGSNPEQFVEWRPGKSASTGEMGWLSEHGLWRREKPKGAKDDAKGDDFSQVSPPTLNDLAGNPMADADAIRNTAKTTFNPRLKQALAGIATQLEYLSPKMSAKATPEERRSRTLEVIENYAKHIEDASGRPHDAIVIREIAKAYAGKPADTPAQQSKPAEKDYGPLPSVVADNDSLKAVFQVFKTTFGNTPDAAAMREKVKQWAAEAKIDPKAEPAIKSAVSKSIRVPAFEGEKVSAVLDRAIRKVEFAYATPRENETAEEFAHRHYPELKDSGVVVQGDANMGHAIREFVSDAATMAPVIKALSAKGAKTYVGDAPITKLDHLQTAEGEEVRGWPPGSKWEQVGGVYDRDTGATIVGNGNTGSANVIAHENGHAIGHLLDIDNSKELIEFHKRHFDKLQPYLQQDGAGGFAGRQELFAESVATYYRKGREGVEAWLDKDYANWLESILRGIK